MERREGSDDALDVALDGGGVCGGEKVGRRVWWKRRLGKDPSGFVVLMSPLTYRFVAFQERIRGPPRLRSGHDAFSHNASHDGTP